MLLFLLQALVHLMSFSRFCLPSLTLANSILYDNVVAHFTNIGYTLYQFGELLHRNDLQHRVICRQR